jgi:dihydrodipicolinate synthase/N-acetylneuraminate lyase
MHFTSFARFCTNVNNPLILFHNPHFVGYALPEKTIVAPALERRGHVVRHALWSAKGADGTQ